MTQRVILSGATAPYAWSLNGEYWPNVTPLMSAPGQRVTIEMLNHSMMAHPMHLHGHAFQVMAINDAALAGAVRDTVLVPPMDSVTIAFDANNPGRWAFSKFVVGLALIVRRFGRPGEGDVHSTHYSDERI